MKATVENLAGLGELGSHTRQHRTAKAPSAKLRRLPPRKAQAPKPKPSARPVRRITSLLPSAVSASTLSPLDVSYVPTFMPSGSASGKITDVGEAPAYSNATRPPVSNKNSAILETINQGISTIFNSRSGSRYSGAGSQNMNDESGGIGAGATPLLIGGAVLVVAVLLMSGRK
jgi:hypothetical protein